MCGIAGVIGQTEAAVRAALREMVACQAHRGPDDSGESILPFGDRWLGLGHRRLSILDLSAAGHQPMVHPGLGNQIVFNGEIYNFQDLRRELESLGDTFVGHSDTEVLLHGLSRWGPDYCSKLQGMYAFAFINPAAGELFLARDPLGIKPLYLAENGSTLVFASEVRAILASGMVPRRIDMQALAGYLAYGAVQQPRTIIESVVSMEPGSWREYRAASTAGGPARSSLFWNFRKPDPAISMADAITNVESTLDAAVRDHLISDVPVGVFLSSGLDSTIVASLAAKHSKDVRSFCVGFGDQPDLSELGLAGETAKHLGLNHTEIVLNSEGAEAIAWDWLESLDQPSLDGLNVFVISKSVRSHGIKVALSGQGGDELFGGYPSFRDVPRMKPFVRMMAAVPRPMRRLICNIVAANRSVAVRQKLGDLFDNDGTVTQLYLQRRRAMSKGQLRALGINPASLGIGIDFLPADALNDIVTLADGASDDIWMLSQLEARMYQGNMLLRDGDANGMAHGLEIRVPILDQRVVDFASTIPGNIRLPDAKSNKHLLRVAFAPYLRPALLKQAKMGFTLPIRRWMLGPMRDLCESALYSLKNSGCVATAGVDKVWEQFLREPESPIWSRAWALCVVGSYIKRLGLTPGAVETPAPQPPLAMMLA